MARTEIGVFGVGSADFGQLRYAARSANTRIAYEKGWRCFSGWCDSTGILPLDAGPGDVSRFFVAMGTEPRHPGGSPLSSSTLRLYRTALNDRWKRAGRESPAASVAVDDVLRGIARLRGDKPRRVRALRDNQIVELIRRCGDGTHGRRDAAVLALGFAAALRRSELCGLKVEDVERQGPKKLVLRIRHSKTDQVGRGQRGAVIEGKAVRPISHLNAWLEAVGVRSGFLFQTLRCGGIPTGRPLHPGEVARIVKRYVGQVGLDPRDYSAHSLRAGFVTSAAVHHARLDKIMEVTRHRSTETVLKYIRDEDSFVDHAGAAFL